MDVYDKKTAEQIVAAWLPYGERGRKMLRGFADDQRVCAQLAKDLGRPNEVAGHRAACTVLSLAAGVER